MKTLEITTAAGVWLHDEQPHYAGEIVDGVPDDVAALVVENGHAVIVAKRAKAGKAGADAGAADVSADADAEGDANTQV